MQRAVGILRGGVSNARRDGRTNQGVIWFLCNCGTGVSLLTIAGILVLFISGVWPLAVVWLICKIVLCVCSAMGVEDDDMKAIAVVTVLDTLVVVAVCCYVALYDGSGAEAFGIFFCLMGAIGMTALDVNLIKEARKKSERKKSEENQDVH